MSKYSSLTSIWSVEKAEMARVGMFLFAKSVAICERKSVKSKGSVTSKDNQFEKPLLRNGRQLKAFFGYDSNLLLVSNY